MRAVIQRVSRASVTVDGSLVGAIKKGFLVLLGVEDDDSDEDAVYLANKIAGLRVFEDENEKMNLALADVGGEVLVVSQFTLLGDCRHGRRPSFTRSAKPQEANRLYEKVVSLLREKKIVTATGQFQAHMKISLINDGPVTLLLDSKKIF
jgi:D-tyrosyl-tRNA(Tyr) deacylase